MAATINRREAAALINSSTAGVVPRIGLRHIAVGRQPEQKGRGWQHIKNLCSTCLPAYVQREARRDLPVDSIIDDQNWYEF